MPNFTSEINQIFAVQPTAHRIMLRTANDLGGEPKSGRFFACFTCYCVGPYTRVPVGLVCIHFGRDF